MGDQDNHEACVNTEAACIDFVFDSFWRGRPFESIMLEDATENAVQKINK
jgi:hypothetical protein